MKIQDLIKLEKTTSENGRWENKTQLKYEKKKGYYWKIPSHSKNESVLLNNYEKDCVLAYIENKYFIAFLVKVGGKDNFKSFVYSKDFLNWLFSYKIDNIPNKKIWKAFKEDEGNLKIVEDEEYLKFNRLLILESLEK